MRDRKTYLGSGDIAAVAGVSPYRSALDVWAQKTGMVPDTIATPRMLVGVELEQPIIRALYAAPRELVIDQPGWVGHKTIPHFGATVDAIARDVADERRVVECKVVGTHGMKRWGDVDDGAESVPSDVLVQVQWQFCCTGEQIADVVALLGTDLRVYRVERDDEMIANLETIGAAFWEKVEGRTAPEISAEHAAGARDLIERLYPRQTLDAIDFSPEARALAEQYIAARDEKTAADKAQKAAGAALCAFIGEHEGLLADDLKATWIAGDKGSTKWKDVAIAAGASPTLIAEYTGKASRTLNVRRITRR